MAVSSQDVVYGTDNRQDVYMHADATLRARAQQATVALMRPSDFNATNPNNVTFNGQTLGAAYNLCTTERFREDPAAAFCSGTLIDDDLVLTAGHCITSATDCSNTRFVFNYYRPAAGTLQTVTTADIFSCASIVARQQGTVNGQNLDYAVVRLDRAATPRFTPAPVRTANTALTVGQNVAVIGSGSGIPFKIDSGGLVRNARTGTLDYFVATTDTFGGNSGSGVYETSGYTVAGILVRGETDYVYNGSCRVVNVCSETGCRGEDVTYVYQAIRAFCAATNNGSARLCTQVTCVPCPMSNSWYDGANCARGTPPSGTSPFIYNGGLYYTPVLTPTCPMSNSWYDGANCARGTPPSGTSPFIYNGGLYYTALPGNQCPMAGSWYDGANCFAGTPPAGTTPFVHDGGLYYTPARVPSCPLSGSWYDGANCFAGTPPAGTTPFVYNGGLYYTPVCRP